jgi:hypothetical protein
MSKTTEELAAASPYSLADWNAAEATLGDLFPRCQQLIVDSRDNPRDFALGLVKALETPVVKPLAKSGPA